MRARPPKGVTPKNIPALIPASGRAARKTAGRTARRTAKRVFKGEKISLGKKLKEIAKKGLAKQVHFL